MWQCVRGKKIVNGPIKRHHVAPTWQKDPGHDDVATNRVTEKYELVRR